MRTIESISSGDGMDMIMIYMEENPIGRRLFEVDDVQKKWKLSEFDRCERRACLDKTLDESFG
jgi:hypothetical protein